MSFNMLVNKINWNAYLLTPKLNFFNVYCNIQFCTTNLNKKKKKIETPGPLHAGDLKSISRFKYNMILSPYQRVVGRLYL